ncbi:MAG TPA: 50S ribosomal protein L11 methyltransferase [Vicinamibacteria bacterium]|nr:50S ribosomal protein L11 methyltransferase [Vicinamibacteria bacterium]
MIAFELTVPAAAEDAATLLLWEHGTAGIEVRAPGARDLVLLAYFEPAGGLEERLRGAITALPGARLARTELPSVDWVARYREGFRPFHAGGFLIAPCWDVPAADGLVLVVDPGQAFGTGTHESTRLCLDALADLCASSPPASVLDVGTGSGILAVAAALRGARRVTATDVDPEALRCARRHVELNRADVRLMRADGARAVRRGAFDLVLANLTAPLLRERREEIVAARAQAGALVLSGFLREDAATLARSYAAAGRIEARHDGEWTALVVRGGPA